MAGHHFLKQTQGAPAPHRLPGRATVNRLLQLIAQHVIERFNRLGQTDLRVVALAIHEPDEEDPPANPSHPACVEFAASDYCRESWQLHLARLKRQPETHWGVCDHRRACAIIPIAHGDRCLAVVKLAGPASMDEKEFQRLVELLELLVRDFVAAKAAFLERVPGGLRILGAHATTHLPNECPENVPNVRHPQAARALEYVASHLSDPRLTVARVASVLGICPTYLSQLFVEQTGQRLSHVITRLRIDKAKKLLTTTDWQVKRIAIETGHANPNWFSHIFCRHTGLTPGKYRTAARTSHAVIARKS